MRRRSHLTCFAREASRASLGAWSCRALASLGVLVVALVAACGSVDTASNRPSSAGAGGASGGASGQGPGGSAGSQGGTGGSNPGTADSGIGAACAGAAPPPTGYSTCRTQQDCTGGDICSPAPMSQSCVGCSLACQSNSDCQPGEVCYSTPCFCPSSPSLTVFRACIPRCTSTSCAADEVCGSDGLCAPEPCTAGYTCPAGQICNPLSTAPHGCDYASCVTDGYICPSGYVCSTDGGSKDVHGCVAIPCGPGAPPCPPNTECTGTGDPRGCSSLPCTTDGDCDCGACIFGHCSNTLWVCVAPPPQ